jgi:hypothetical protein
LAPTYTIFFEPDGEHDGVQLPVLAHELEVRHPSQAYVEQALLLVGHFEVDPTDGERKRTVILQYLGGSYVELEPGERRALLDAAPFNADPDTAAGRKIIALYARTEARILHQVAQRILGLPPENDGTSA